MSFAFDRIPHEASVGFSQYNSSNREPLLVPGGSAMLILVPWKPVVLVWGLLSGMILVGFVASSLREGVLSFKQRLCDGTNQYHPAQQSPHEKDWLPGNDNQHHRTSGDEVRPTVNRYCTAKNPKLVS